jgi:hypothetical protein
MALLFLGLVHNDLTLASTIFAKKDDETPIIVDLGSCRTVGHSTQDWGKTPEWYDANVLTLLHSDDTDALNEIAEWLSLQQNKSYKSEVAF